MGFTYEESTNCRSRISVRECTFVLSVYRPVLVISLQQFNTTTVYDTSGVFVVFVIHNIGVHKKCRGR